MKRSKTLSAGLTIGILAFSLPASAAVTINISQSGSDVVATSIGSIDLTGLSLITQTNYTLVPSVRATDAFIATGPANVLVQGYSGITGPLDIGSGATVSGTSGSGDPFGFNIFPINVPAGVARIFLPLNYVSGQGINSSATFANSTIQSLGLAVGQYTYSAPNDSIIVNVLAPAVPEPATWAMMLVGFGLIGTVIRRRSVVKTSVHFA